MDMTKDKAALAASAFLLATTTVFAAYDAVRGYDVTGGAAMVESASLWQGSLVVKLEGDDNYIVFQNYEGDIPEVGQTITARANWGLSRTVGGSQSSHHGLRWTPEG
jgi:hypothetical protein